MQPCGALVLIVSVREMLLLRGTSCVLSMKRLSVQLQSEGETHWSWSFVVGLDGMIQLNVRLWSLNSRLGNVFLLSRWSRAEWNSSGIVSVLVRK